MKTLLEDQADIIHDMNLKYTEVEIDDVLLQFGWMRPAMAWFFVSMSFLALIYMLVHMLICFKRMVSSSNDEVDEENSSVPPSPEPIQLTVNFNTYTFVNARPTTSDQSSHSPASTSVIQGHNALELFN